MSEESNINESPEAKDEGTEVEGHRWKRQELTEAEDEGPEVEGHRWKRQEVTEAGDEGPEGGDEHGRWK